MFEVFEKPESVAAWHVIVRGEADDWDGLMGDYTATVDWPACAYWPELLAANPDAIVLLSSRSTPEKWWASMEKTIVATLTMDLRWEPICAALGVAVPSDPFPHQNTSEEFRTNIESLVEG